MAASMFFSGDISSERKVDLKRLIIEYWPSPSHRSGTSMQIGKVRSNHLHTCFRSGTPKAVRMTARKLPLLNEGLVRAAFLFLSRPFSIFDSFSPAGDRVPQETTRDYNVRQNTTVDEDPFPGKLPETPLQAVIPASSYKVR